MSSAYRFGESRMPHFITYATVQWADALSRPHYKQIIADSLRYCIEKKGLILHAWVIMSNHVHLIAAAAGCDLAGIMRDHKKLSAAAMLQAIDFNSNESRRGWMMWLFRAAGEANANNKNYQFWQQDNHPIILDNEDKLMSRLRYVHENPVRASLVERAEHYIWSSAADYAAGRARVGMLPLVMID